VLEVYNARHTEELNSWWS